MRVGKDVQVDWKSFAEALGDIRVIDNPAIRKAKSKDFYWYSPILKEQLDGHVADLVVLPRDRDELATVVAHAVAHKVPITLRGRGSGNYGQCVPLAGGIVIDLTEMKAIIDIGVEMVRVEAGCTLGMVEDALNEKGRELPVASSTMRIATVGGFLGGGSSGVGSVENGPLREHGNIIEITVMSVEAKPRMVRVTGEDVLAIHHAWGLNGIIVDATLKTCPKRDWWHAVVTFSSYEDVYAAGAALGEMTSLTRRLVCTVDEPLVQYLEPLHAFVGDGDHLLVTMIATESLEQFKQWCVQTGGHLAMCLSESERRERKIPPMFEFSYNHTTLAALQKDPGVTYLQVTMPIPPERADIKALRAQFGDEVLMHHEFTRFGGDLYAVDLPVVRYANEARLRQLEQIYAQHDCEIADAHTCVLEDGGMKGGRVDHLVWKKKLDPHGLLNPGKSRLWSRLKDLSPEEIAHVKLD